jgi:DNA-binding FadR family transcriptional regulator
MAFVPVHREPVSAAVFAQLRAGILSGDLAVGEPLPPERVLAESFQVNRHAVREALKRLQQAGLVEVAHGGATRVLDFRRSAGLDLLPHLVDGPEDLAAEVLRSGLEMRRAVGAEVARLAAVRADDAARARILERARAYRADGRESWLEADRAFWAELVDAADNIAFHSLLEVIDAHSGQMDEILDDGRTDAAGHVELAEAVGRGDGDDAAAVARRVLTTALVAAGRFLSAPPEPPPAGAATTEPVRRGRR